MEPETPQHSASSPLVFAYALDGRGGSQPVAAEEVMARAASGEAMWIHLDLERDSTRDWLMTEAGLSEGVAEALLEDETRPRTLEVDGGVLLNLRGLNRAADAEPEDMVAIRLYLQERVLISARRRPLAAARELEAQLKQGQGPETTSGIVAELTAQLADACERLVDRLEDSMDELEEASLTGSLSEQSARLADERHTVLQLRRHLAPQRQALRDLLRLRTPWIEDQDHAGLQRASQDFTRLVEDLEVLRERAVVVQDQLQSQQAERVGHRMYLMSVIAAVFIPLNLVAGMLGMNVGGLPLAQDPAGFLVVSLAMITVGMVMAWWLHRLRWF